MNMKKAEVSFEPEVVLLYCQHCVNKSANITAQAKGISGFRVQSVMMPCSSKIEVSYILRILERGVDAVQVVVCPANKCRFLIGSSRTAKRIEYVRRLLDEIDIGAERVGISSAAGLRAEKLMDLAAERAKAVEPLGANPMKNGELR
jgi:F420-non-reducing hydrogenase iron-sulfur subunit